MEREYMPLAFSKDAEIALRAQETQKAANIAELHIQRAKLSALNWIDENRSDLKSYLRDAECFATRKHGVSGEVYTVSIIIQGTRGKQFFEFEVDFGSMPISIRKMQAYTM